MEQILEALKVPIENINKNIEPEQALDKEKIDTFVCSICKLVVEISRCRHGDLQKLRATLL